MDGTLKLRDIGERTLIARYLVPRYGHVPHYGDDCAFVADTASLPEGCLVTTTDPGPVPMACLLGIGGLYHQGWLLATVNLSDLAAAGAMPLGLVVSMVLPLDLPVDEFMLLLDGIDDCCHRCGTEVLGGNLKEGAAVDLVATAIGICPKGRYVSRRGARAGDAVVVIGDLGLFWAGSLAHMKGVPVEDAHRGELLRNLLTPLPKVQIAREIADRGLLTACMDNSDGLYVSLAQLSETNSVCVRLLGDEIVLPPAALGVADRLGIEPLRLALGWGDWQLVGCVDPAGLDELRSIGLRHGVPVNLVGRVEGGLGVILESGGRSGFMAPMDSQRLDRRSFYTAGVGAYAEQLLFAPLWQDGSGPSL